MNKYAVVKIGGNQYRVEEGQEILVDKLNGAPKAEVLLVANGDKVKIGEPEVKGSIVKLKVLDEQVKGEKLHVQTFKAKSRYRRKVGFRPLHTRLLVQKIN